VRKCFPVTTAPVNYTELVDEFVKLQSEIETQMSYIDGNVTALVQLNNTLVAQIEEKLANTTLSAADRASLEKVLAGLRGNFTSTATTAGARRKRQTTNLTKTPCNEASDVLKYLNDSITRSNLCEHYAEGFSTFLILIFDGDDLVVVIWKETLIIEFQVIIQIITLAFKSTINVYKRQKTILEIIKNAVCAKNFGPCGE
jgi:hypothetical protein